MIWEASFTGKVRIKKKFAWYPRTMNYYTVWLRCYYVLEEFNVWDGLWFPYWSGVCMGLTREQIEDTRRWRERTIV